MSEHVIMGTAGHVDHGKTTLVKALTGVDCDTHKEEKKRGITINLGFTHLNNPNKSQIGIVDVPGHKDFIKTMISGVGGIDFVMLVIAADSGIMPQTSEHLKILQTLGINSGIIVLSKTDTVESLLIEIAIEEIRSFVKGSFLENAPIIQVSAKTNFNIDKLKELILITADKYSKKESQLNCPFRMYIDRIFSPPGIGTVITGSAINGKLNISDNIFILPSDSKHNYRLKSIQKYGSNSNNIIKGERAAINISGFKKEDFKRGMLISNSNLTETRMFDAEIEFFINESSNILGKIFQKNTPWLHVIFYIGTLETKAKIHILDLKLTENDNYFFAQIHIEQPCICRFGDKFIIRNSSGNYTLGGGTILDPLPLHHKRRSCKVIDSLNKINTENITELLKLEVFKNLGIIDSEELVIKTNYSKEEINDLLPINDNTITTLEFENNDYLLIENNKYSFLNKQLIKVISKHHKSLPLSNIGLSSNVLEHKLGLDNYSSGQKLLSYMLNKNEISQRLKKVGKTWALFNHNVEITEKLKKDIKFIESSLKNYNMTVPLMNSLISDCKAKRNIELNELNQILKFLVGTNKVYRIDDSYIHTEIVDKCRRKLIEYLSLHTEGITVAKFRDIVEGNRKMCLLLLNIYDKEKTTKRDGDLRFLNT